MASSSTDQSDFYWALLRLSLGVKRRFITAADSYDLKPFQSILLCILRTDQQMTMRSVAQLIGCDPSNISDAAESLVRSGHIVRAEAPGDRRTKLLSLTDQGKRVRQILFDNVAAENLPGKGVLTADESAALRRLLVKALTAE